MGEKDKKIFKENFENYINDSIEEHSLEEQSLSRFCKKYSSWTPTTNVSVNINVI